MADSKKFRIELTRELVFVELFDYRDDIEIAGKEVSKARAIFEEKQSREQADENKQTLVCLCFWGEKADKINDEADEMIGELYSISFNVESRFIKNKDGDWVPITEATAFKWEVISQKSKQPERRSAGSGERRESKGRQDKGEKRRDERRASPLYGGDKTEKKKYGGK